MSKPELGYWNIRGLAAPMRYILHYKNVDFTDKVYNLGPGPEYNKDCWFVDSKPHLAAKMTYPNLPYFVDGDFYLSESAAILKYIAHKYAPELLGKTSQEYAHAEMMQEFVGTLKGKLTGPAYSGSGNREELLAPCWPILDKIVSFLGSKHWLCGENLMWIDFFFFEQIEYINFLLKDTTTLFEKYPTLKAYHDRLMSDAKFAAVYADDQKCMKFPFNNDFAKIGGRDS